MYKFYHYKPWVVYSSFVIAIILQVIPLFPKTWCLQPSWIMISLVHWATVFPNQVSIGTGFVLGLVTDIILGSTLGIHSLSLSILVYLTIRKIKCFRHMPIWQQSLVVTFLSFINQSIIFILKFIITKVLCAPEIFWSCLFDGGSWPFLIFLMYRIYQY